MSTGPTNGSLFVVTAILVGSAIALTLIGKVWLHWLAIIAAIITLIHVAGIMNRK